MTHIFIASDRNGDGQLFLLLRRAVAGYFSHSLVLDVRYLTFVYNLSSVNWFITFD